MHGEVGIPLWGGVHNKCCSFLGVYTGANLFYVNHHIDVQQLQCLSLST